MYKLFSIAGYTEKDVNEKFSGMINMAQAMERHHMEE